MVIGLVLGLSAVLAAVCCWVDGAFLSMAWLWKLPLSFVGFGVVTALLALGFFVLACYAIKIQQPQEKDSPFYRRLAEEYLQAIFPVLRVKIHTTGKECLPEDGRFLLVCNHRHIIDPAILLFELRGRQLAFISKREAQNYFVVGRLMHKLMCQPINRENDREALKTILKCVQILKEDLVSVGVFPEGYIHPDCKLHHFRHGVFKIAQKAKVPVVVCTMTGTKEALPLVMKLKPAHIHLHFLTTVYPADYENLTTVELSERVYNTMAADLGPEYVSNQG